LDTAKTALTPIETRDLLKMGILELFGDRVRSAIQLAVHGGLIFACDAPRDISSCGPDYLVGVLPSSVSLACITVRKRFKTALDLGASCGIQSILAAMHCEKVTAVDINPRALVYTAFNAQMGGQSNIEVKQDDMLEAVKGRKFDLIMCNPPFVISPDFKFWFRDGGGVGDSLCETIVRGVAESLEEGEFAHVVCNWTHKQNDDWSGQVRRWTAGGQCDALVLRGKTETPRDYAEGHNAYLQETNQRQFYRVVGEWTRYYHDLGLESITSGAVILRKRAGADNWTRVESHPSEQILPSSAHILQIFANQDYLSSLDTNDQILDAAFTLTESCSMRPEFQARNGENMIHQARVALRTSLRFQSNIDATSLGLLCLLGCNRDLATLIGEFSECQGLEAAAVKRNSLLVIGRLIALGFTIKFDLNCNSRSTKTGQMIDTSDKDSENPWRRLNSTRNLK
jgi:hypothetical protein